MENSTQANGTAPTAEHPIVDLLRTSIPVAASLLKGGVPVLSVVEVLMQILHSYRIKANAEAEVPAVPVVPSSDA